MEERKVLELAKPILRTWSSESQFESILLLQKNGLEWIYDNYINLLGSWDDFEKTSNLGFIPSSNPLCQRVRLSTWIKCPFLDFYYLSHNFVRNKYNNILEYIMYAIEDGYYILMDINQEKLSVRMKDKIHKILIYGFDRKEKLLYVSDHYDNGKYALANLGFDEFYESYEITYWISFHESMVESGKKMIMEDRIMVAARPRPFNYKLNIEWIKLQLTDYLTSSYNLHGALFVEERGEFYYGISSYDLAIAHIDKLIILEERVQKDWRTFSLICDHKDLLKRRVEFFLQSGVCKVSNKELIRYDGLKQSAEHILKLFLKYVVSNKQELLKQIKGILIEMKEEEYELLCELRAKL